MRVGRVRVEVVRDLVVAVVLPKNLVGACRRSQAQRTAAHRELNCAHHTRRPVQGVHQRVVLLTATLSARVEMLAAGQARVAVAPFLLHAESLVPVLAALAVGCGAVRLLLLLVARWQPFK